MKYLKLYEDTYVTNENTYKDYIDWKFIDDIIDMSMDYIDNGCYLNILIIHNNINVLSVQYVEYKKIITWYLMKKSSMSKSIDQDSLEYHIKLYNLRRLEQEDILDTKELIERARIAYPHKKISLY